MNYSDITWLLGHHVYIVYECASSTQGLAGSFVIGGRVHGIYCERKQAEVAAERQRALTNSHVAVLKKGIKGLKKIRLDL